MIVNKLKEAASITLRAVADEVVPCRRRFRRAWPLIDSIDGFLVPGQERWLYQTAYDLPANAAIVEIGSFKGRSTSCLALACKNTGKRVYAIDTFDGNDVDFHERNFFPDFRHNLERAGLLDYVVPTIGLSSDIGRKWSIPIDLIFIDGSHDYSDVLADFETFYPHVKPGGLVAFHDVTPGWDGVVQCWENVASSRLYDTGMCETIAYGRKPGARRVHNFGSQRVQEVN